MACDTLPPLIDVNITGGHVEKVARHIQGGAGPGGSDASQWQNYLLRYGAHSAKLRDAMAELARKIANNVVNWVDICALMSSHLIALDKCPGVTPIAIGEEPRRILCKVLAMATGSDVIDLCGVRQVCSGLKAGIEGSVHAMRKLYEEHCGNGWELLLVDAKNAFNSLNRVAALWNVRVQLPRCARFMFNTYRGYAPLILHDHPTILYSKEGVGQGDPLSMLMYATALTPLIQSLEDAEFTQNWYADDSACVGTFSSLRMWFEKLCQLGPSYGYYPEPKKTVIVVDEKDEESANVCFHNCRQWFPFPCWWIYWQQRAH